MARTAAAPARPDLDRLRAATTEAGFEALLLTSAAARGHVLGAEHAVVVLTAAGTVAGGPDPAGTLRAAGAGTGPAGFEDDLPWEVFGRLSNTGITLRPAADLIFGELIRGADAEAAAELAAVGYTAVMDHLHVGMDVREITANVDRSLRRAGGLLGWYPPGAGVGSDLVTMHGHDPRTAQLTATSPLHYTLHPVLDGCQGFATATAILSKATPALRDTAESCSAATESLIAALRPGAPLRDGFAAAAREFGDRPGSSRIFALRGGSALPLGPSSELLGEPGTVLGVRATVAAPEGGAVELAETVLITGSGPQRLAKTPLRLVELY
ncbi:metallopeptidase family M24 [Amycolatopsis sulphurea]|uniref:Metallopeptidase family M24 n=1 Tax=Amycolatopsis sulphurea TaxID=76022 RepID=A0A2A9FJB7_9PSEU|nr:M24 family metallopeptidase [Amycolatopsis sulphurea]PFG51033.1 metallopeptidase family M24 [Amycolatopsis sulphurea]